MIKAIHIRSFLPRSPLFAFSSIAQRRPLIETHELAPLIEKMESNLKIVNTTL